LLVLAAVGLTLYLLRAPLLRRAALLLMAEDPPGPAGHVVVLGPGMDLREGLRMWGEGQAAGLLLLAARPGLAQRLGAIPTDAEAVRRAVERHGIPADRLHVLPLEDNSDRSRCRCLQGWLEENPEAQATFLAESFHGSRWRYLLGTHLSPGVVGRVRLRLVPQPAYDENNWWQHTQGQVDFFGAAVSYIHLRLAGEGEEGPPWDPDQYEKSLQATTAVQDRPAAGGAGSAGW
jgi:hypothetical protein